MTWSYWVGAGGLSLPVLVLLVFAMRRAKGVVEMLVKAYIETRTEREQRATMVAMAQSLPNGGAAARFEEGRWRGCSARTQPTRQATGPSPRGRLRE